jgi:DNA repair protein RadC
MRLAEIHPSDRPRERMKRKGMDALTDGEVLALILQKGTRKDNVVDMSNRLISKFTLEKLGGMSLSELSSIEGIGEAKAMQILAAFEISKRVKTFEGSKISCAKDVFDKYHLQLKDLLQEQFIVLVLNTKNRIIKEEVISKGTLNSSIIHPREIFKSAIRESGNAIIVVHNHPSGDCTPSDEDIEITERIAEAGRTLNIPLLDHVIVGKRKWWSWKK